MKQLVKSFAETAASWYPRRIPEALVDAVLALRQDPALRRQLGANGRAYVEAHFTKDRVLRAYDEFFRSVDPEVSSLPLAARQEGSGT